MNVGGQWTIVHAATVFICEGIAMDAQIFQMAEQRSKRAAHAASLPLLDVVRATSSAAAFFTWYTGALLRFHVTLLRAALERAEP